MDLPNRLQPDDSSSPRDHLVLSQERLGVSTIRVPSGWARLEKFLVTETRTITVEVTHEEIRVVRGPGPQDGSGLPPNPGQNGARWMPVHREEVVVSKRVVPVERVRLEVYPVTEQRQITEEIRKERLDTHGTDTPIASDPDFG